jgi:antagonist of KipI
VAAMHVVKPGLLTTVQDRGRWGFQALGVSVAGPMDPVSHRVANAMVGNAGDAAALEVTLVGPELVFDDERIVAVAGAEFEIAIDRHPVISTGGFVVPAGATLRFGRRLRGTRAYIAIAGGIDTPPVLGSRATHLPSAMGGFRGRALAAGDRLACGAARTRSNATAQVRPAAAPNSVPDGRATLRVLPGPQSDRFAPGTLDALQSAPYRIASSSNRMGFRLSGPPLAHTRGADVISDATPLGVVQVPASGQPILLMADRQTCGGYPKIATVITADIGLAGQLGPGDTIAFAVCSPGEAMTALIGQEQHLMAFEAGRR